MYWIDRNASIPPPKLSDYIDVSNASVHVEIINSEKRLLTDRFIPPKNLKTRAIYSCDDDIEASPEFLDSLFEMYLSNNFRNYMLGSVSRSCVNGKYHKKDAKFNMVLTSACFLDVKMLELFQLPKYQKAREWINKRFNGEDIMMSFIVQENFLTPPIATPIHIKPRSDGLSNRRSHHKQRHQACGFFKSYFGFDLPHTNKGNIFKHPTNQLVPIN